MSIHNLFTGVRHGRAGPRELTSRFLLPSSMAMHGLTILCTAVCCSSSCTLSLLAAPTLSDDHGQPRQFGTTTVDVKPILSRIPTVLAHADKSVRSEVRVAAHSGLTFSPRSL